MKGTKTLFAVSLSLLFCSNRCQSNKQCPEDIICTMIFKSIAVEIVDSQGEYVWLSKAELSSDYLDEPIDVLAEASPGLPYQIVNDGHMQFLNHLQARTFIFKGWIHDSLVVDEKYKLRHDCCHVVLESGAEKIIIDNQTSE